MPAGWLSMLLTPYSVSLPPWVFATTWDSNPRQVIFLSPTTARGTGALQSSGAHLSWLGSGFLSSVQPLFLQWQAHTEMRRSGNSVLPDCWGNRFFPQQQV